jgi:replication-associated recombination protein RarA
MSETNYQSSDVWARSTTVNGYAVDEVRSALQKSIRRGDIENAVLAALELYDSGPETEEVLWRRLEIIASEDVGAGWIEAPAVLEALNAQRKRMEDRTDRFMYSAHAVRLLAAAPKDRTTMEIAVWAREVTSRGERKLEIHDWMVDYHTARGARMGRGPAHWWTEGGWRLDNQIDGLNPKYGEYLRKKVLSE